MTEYLHLLHRYGKNARNAMGDLLTFLHLDNNSAYPSSFLCHSMNPDLDVYVPREVEFSCRSTPAYPSFPATRRRHQHQHHRRGHKYNNVAVVKMPEVHDSHISDSNCSSIASSSPAPSLIYGMTPVVRQLRVSDSPFPIKEEGPTDDQIDKEADEFILVFYEQLRQQERGRQYLK